MSVNLSVLFVDDEPNILAAIRRIIKSQKSWKSAYAQSAKEALLLMDVQSFDLIVSDICMPEMDGKELLEIVKRKYPKTIRIALSGQIGVNHAIENIRAAHQFIPKPFDTDSLICTIESVFKYRKVIGSDSIVGVISEIDSLPVLPYTYTRIEEELQSSTPSIVSIADIISQDIALATEILRLINSPYFGLENTILSISQSINLLGLDTVKTFVMGKELFASYDSKILPNYSLKKLWEHSFRVSGIAYMIARYEGFDNLQCTQCRMSGLLHDVGKLVLVSNFPTEYQKILKLVSAAGKNIYECEKDVLGATHSEVGLFLLQLWGLCGTTIDDIATHHKLTEELSPAFIVSAANIIDHCCVVLNENYYYNFPQQLTKGPWQLEKIKEWAFHISESWQGDEDFKSVIVSNF